MAWKEQKPRWQVGTQFYTGINHAETLWNMLEKEAGFHFKLHDSGKCCLKIIVNLSVLTWGRHFDTCARSPAYRRCVEPQSNFLQSSHINLVKMCSNILTCTLANHEFQPGRSQGIRHFKCTMIHQQWSTTVPYKCWHFDSWSANSELQLYHTNVC